jgi:hypothetical protein
MAVAAAARIKSLDHHQVRQSFSRRFTARQMTENYLQTCDTLSNALMAIWQESRARRVCATGSTKQQHRLGLRRHRDQDILEHSTPPVSAFFDDCLKSALRSMIVPQDRVSPGFWVKANRGGWKVRPRLQAGKPDGDAPQGITRVIRGHGFISPVCSHERCCGA